MESESATCSSPSASPYNGDTDSSLGAIGIDFDSGTDSNAFTCNNCVVYWSCPDDGPSDDSVITQVTVSGGFTATVAAIALQQRRRLECGSASHVLSEAVRRTLNVVYGDWSYRYRRTGGLPCSEAVRSVHGHVLWPC